MPNLMRILASSIRIIFIFAGMKFSIDNVFAQEQDHEHLLSRVRFQTSGPATTESMLIYRGTLGQMSEATFCFRLRIQQTRDKNSVFSYALSDIGNEIYLSLSYKDQILKIECCDRNWDQELPMAVGLREWINVCLSADLTARKWQLIRNGKFSNGTMRALSKGPIKIRPGGTLVIGQEQNSLLGGFSEYMSLSGSLSDVKLYSFLLTTEQMVNYTTCKELQTIQPPVVNFSSIARDFTVRNVDLDTVETNETCDIKRNFDLVFPELRDFEEGELICDIAGGILSLPKNTKENEVLFNLSLPYAEDCGDSFAETLWIGVKGDVVTQQWLTYPGNQPITWGKFEKDLGLPIQSPDTCVSFIGSNNTVSEQFGRWIPSDCTLEMCAVCHFDTVVIVRMRGLCQQSEFDRDYFLTHDQGSLSFTGVYYSEIVKSKPNMTVADSDYGYWTLRRLDKPKVTAILPMQSPIHYPVGVHTWHVQNDVCGEEKIRLKMTSCADYKFSCEDGTCIRIQERCDQETDCPDGTDEIECYILKLPDGYDSSKPPSRVDRSQPLKIYLHITIMSMRNIDLSHFQFICELEIKLKWIDNRLKYHHLKFNEILNTIDDRENMPWVPSVEFLGDGETSSDVEEQRGSLRIQRVSNPYQDNDEHIYEDEIFDGEHNPLIYKRKLTVMTKCQFDLEAFPFDTQSCSMGIVLSKISKEYVVLVPEKEDKGVSFIGSRKLLEYRLVSETMVQFEEGNYSGQAVRVVFKNLSNFYVTSTYIPTLVIVIIGYTVFYFPLWSFNERVMVGLTGLLVEATFFSQVNESIPHTAYLKLVDIWFVFCIITLFLVVVSIVFINWLQEESRVTEVVPFNTKHRQSWMKLPDITETRKKRAIKCNHICRVAFPMLASLFFLGYILGANLM